jgi:hypothetical protein
MLRISDIHAVENEKKKIRKAIYKEIYATFTRKIKHCVEMGHKHVLLAMPGFVFGQPMFDRGRACTYLKRQLENGGFTVGVLENYNLYVSWDRSEKTSRREELAESVDDSPFVSLMNLKKAASKYR